MNDAGVIYSFNDYELLEELARGGMGVVYRAHQKSLNREVAVKLILGGQLVTPETVQRFHLEAEAAARLDHPGIVPIYEIGDYESQHFFSMKLIKGPNLQESLTRFCINPKGSARQILDGHRRIAELTRKIAEAVNYAHEHGVLHRDLKPSNILLESNDEPVVSDFGLAKISDSDQHDFTMTSTVLGSPAYMSPEQALGNSNRVTTATDVYGIGVILYSLLTGQAPFLGATPLDVIQSVASDEPVAPRKLNPAVDHDLETIALKCLEKEPNRRYANAAEVGSEVLRFLTGRPVIARPASSIERLSRYCRRNPVVSGLVCLVVLLAGFGVLGVTNQWRAAVAESRRADNNAKQAMQERDKARWEAYRSRIALAANALHENQIDVARGALLAAPAAYRNWEWEYFNTRLDVPTSRYELSHQGTPVGLWYSDDGSRLCCTLGSEFTGGAHQTTVWDTQTKDVVLAEESDSLLSPDFSKLAFLTEDGEVAVRNLGSQRVNIIPHKTPALKHLVGITVGGDIATRSEQGLHVWRAGTGKQSFKLLGKPNAFFGERYWEFSGKQFLYQGGNAIQGYDAATGILNWTLDLTGEEVHTVAYNATSGLLAISREYPHNSAELWDAITRKRAFTLKGHRNVVFRMKFRPDGQLLATASPDKTVRIWDTTTGNQRFLLSGHQNDILDLAFDRTGQILASSALDGTVRLWDVDTGQQIGTISTNAHKLVFHPIHAILATADKKGTVRQWKLEEVIRQQWIGHKGFVYGLDIHPDGQTLASTGWDQSLHIWNTASGRNEKIIDLQQKGFGTRFSANGDFLAVATPLSLKIFRTRDWEQLGTAEICSYDIGTQAGVRPDFHPDNTWIVCGNHLTPVIYEVPSGKVDSMLTSHDGTVTDCRFVDGGRVLISVGGTQIRFHDVSTRTLRATTQVPGAILSLGLNRSRTMFCVSNTRNDVYVFETNRPGKPEVTLQHSSVPYSMVFSNDDTRLFVGCHDGTICVWDLIKSELVAALRGHTDYVHTLDIDRSDTLFSGSGDFTLRKWERKAHQETLEQ